MKTEWIYSNFGGLPFFDQYLRTAGGSRLGWKIVGLILAFVGILMATGLVDDFIRWMISPLTGIGGSSTENAYE